MSIDPLWACGCWRLGVGLHPDRLLPAEPGERAIAPRQCDAMPDAGDLTARRCRSELVVDDRPFRTQGAVRHARPLRARLDTPISPN